MKNKILPILCTFILISFIFINSCFAYTSSDIDSITNSSPYIIYSFEGSTFLAFSNKSTVDTIVHGEYTKWFGFTNGQYSSTFSDVVIYKYNSESDIFEYSYTGGMNTIENMDVVLLYTNVDIIDYNDRDTIFFQKTPVQSITILALETAEQIPEAMTKALKMIIPVSLIVLLVVFVIYLVRRLIYQAL